MALAKNDLPRNARQTSSPAPRERGASMAVVSRDKDPGSTAEPGHASVRPAEAPAPDPIQDPTAVTAATGASQMAGGPGPRDPQWEAALARARWVARLGVRRRRSDGTYEDWLEPEQRVELERRGRLRLAFYKAADAFAVREGRAPDKPEQRRLLARLIAEEDEARETWSHASAAFAEGEPELARTVLRRFAADDPGLSEAPPEASLQRLAAGPRETELAVGLFGDGGASGSSGEDGGSSGVPEPDLDDRTVPTSEAVPPPEDQEASDGPQVPKDAEALMRELVGDELYDQIWFGPIETMAREMDIDLELVKRAGPEGAAALAAVALYRHFEIKLHRDRVNHLVVALGRRGHKQLESKLLARLAFQNSLGPQHEPYSMTNQELLEANESEAKFLPYWEALDAVLGIIPGASLAGRAIPKLFIHGFKNNIANRNRILKERGVDVGIGGLER